MIGICGTGMGSLAGLLKAAGHDVRGSDEHVYPPMSTQLAEQQIPTFEGFRRAIGKRHLDLHAGTHVLQEHVEGVYNLWIQCPHAIPHLLDTTAPLRNIPSLMSSRQAPSCAPSL